MRSKPRPCTTAKASLSRDALADLEAGERNLRIDAANKIGSTGADVGFVRLDGHEKGSDAIGGGAQFLDDGVELFDGSDGAWSLISSISEMRSRR